MVEQKSSKDFTLDIKPSEIFKEKVQEWLEDGRDQKDVLIWNNTNRYGQPVSLAARIEEVGSDNDVLQIMCIMRLNNHTSSIALDTRTDRVFYINGNEVTMSLWLTTFCKALEDSLTPNQIVNSAAEAQVHVQDTGDQKFNEELYEDFLKTLAAARYRAI